MDLAPEIEYSRFFKKYINFTLLPEHYLPFLWGSLNCQFLVALLYIYHIIHTILVKIGTVVFEKSMFAHYGRRTMNDGHRPMKIGHHTQVT